MLCAMCHHMVTITESTFEKLCCKCIIVAKCLVVREGVLITYKVEGVKIKGNNCGVGEGGGRILGALCLQ
jgi:hypothetical protein